MIVSEWSEITRVARFWSSFRASRDLAIVGLMVLQGLRSAEVLALNRDDSASWSALPFIDLHDHVEIEGNTLAFKYLAKKILDHRSG